jgi:hypothetical protein
LNKDFIMTATPTKKVTKLDQAVEIYKRHLPKKDTLSKKEFRALVVADFKKEMKLTNAGTIGMYFGQADQLASNRAPKQYNRTAPRQTSKSVKARKNAQVDDAKLNQLAATFNAGVDAARTKKAAKKKATETTVTVNNTVEADNAIDSTKTSITGKAPAKKKPAIRAL